MGWEAVAADCLGNAGDAAGQCSGWRGVALDCADLSEAEQSEASAASQAASQASRSPVAGPRPSKKPRGRHGFRKLVREQKAARAAARADDEAALVLPWRSAAATAHARSCRNTATRQLEAEENQQSAQLLLRVRDIGEPLQRELAMSACNEDKRAPDEPLRSILYDSRPVVTGTAEAKQQATSRTSLARRLCEAACAMLLSAPFLLGMLLCKTLDLVRNKKYTLVSMVLRRRYDETPCRISVRHPDKCREEGTVVKLLQTEFACLLLVHDGQRYSQLRCHLPTHLKVLERNTAEQIVFCQREVQQLVPELWRATVLCKHPFLLINTDAYSANYCAERALAKDSVEGDILSRSHYACDVHRMHTCSKRQHQLVDGHISAMIYAALAAQQAGGTRQLRRALSQVLRTRVVVRCGVLADDSFERTRVRDVLNLFLPVATAGVDSQMSRLQRRSLVRRFLISFFLNGDTTCEQTVAFWHPTFGLDRDLVLEAMQTYLVPALIPHKPPVLVRKNWTGAQPAVEWFGLLLSLHNLFEDTMLVYTGTSVRAVPVPRAGGWGRVAALCADSAPAAAESADVEVDFDAGPRLRRPVRQEAGAADEAAPEDRGSLGRSWSSLSMFVKFTKVYHAYGLRLTRSVRSAGPVFLA